MASGVKLPATLSQNMPSVSNGADFWWRFGRDQLSA
jgi:hypothetical protein